MRRAFFYLCVWIGLSATIYALCNDYHVPQWPAIALVAGVFFLGFWVAEAREDEPRGDE